MPGELLQQFPRVIGKGWQDVLQPPGWPLWRTTYHFTSSVWKMPPSWHWTGHSGGYCQMAELRWTMMIDILMLYINAMLMSRKIHISVIVESWCLRRWWYAASKFRLTTCTSVKQSSQKDLCLFFSGSHSITSVDCIQLWSRLWLVLMLILQALSVPYCRLMCKYVYM